MSTSQALSIVDLDFDTIKANLKAYLSSQTEFTDYNFDGSALSVLLDALAYNTHYNALLASLMSNELFIDTAIKRSSVVSLAAMLGYIPRSTSSASATINISITPTGNETTLTLDTTDTFITTIDSNTFTFQPKTSQTVALSNGVFTFSNVEIIEGTSLSNTFAVTPDTVSGPFILPVDTVDTTTIKVAVQNSISDLTTTIFSSTATIVDIDETSQVFWIEENTSGQYQLVFGNGVFGVPLVAGNIVTVSYLASNGDLANGATTFSTTGAIDNESNITISTINSASGGATKEEIDSIRFNAPKYNASKNRVVTEQDYESIILANFPKAKSVVVWGGENNIPPVYGTVYISIDPIQPYVVTQNDENNIIDNIIAPRSMMGIRHEFVDPEYLYIGFTIRATYDRKSTNYSPSQIEAIVLTEVQNYFATNLATLDKTFYYSQFIDALVNSNPSILSVLAQMRIQNRITKTSSFNTTQNLKFLCAVVPGSLKSTSFSSLVNGTSYTAYMQDYANDSIPNATGTGTIKLLQYGTGAVLVSNLGSIDYGTGVVSFNNLNIASYLGNLTDVRVGVSPQEWSKDISPNFSSLTDIQTYAVVPEAARNIIIKLDDSEINQSILLNAGVTVSAITST